jgi:hypothetical protein
MIWMFDTDILIYFVNRKPGYERIARRTPGRSAPRSFDSQRIAQVNDPS